MNLKDKIRKEYVKVWLKMWIEKKIRWDKIGVWIWEIIWGMGCRLRDKIES